MEVGLGLLLSQGKEREGSDCLDPATQPLQGLAQVTLPLTVLLWITFPMKVAYIAASKLLTPGTHEIKSVRYLSHLSEDNS